MSSKIDIANQALTALGATRIISFGDDLTEADVMNTIYEPTKRSVLRGYPWNCATRRAKLAQLTDPPVNEFTYKYALPEDCLKVTDFYTGDHQVRRAEDESTEFVIEGKNLLCNHANVYVKYILDIPEAQMDAHVEMALVAKLSAEASYPIQGSPSNAQMYLQIAELKMNEARTTDNLESGTEIFRTTRLSDVRW